MLSVILHYIILYEKAEEFRNWVRFYRLMGGNWEIRISRDTAGFDNLMRRDGWMDGWTASIGTNPVDG